MFNFGISLCRLRRLKEAGQIFKRILWMNPTDNQGARLVIGPVRDKERWEDFA